MAAGDEFLPHGPVIQDAEHQLLQVILVTAGLARRALHQLGGLIFRSEDLLAGGDTVRQGGGVLLGPGVIKCQPKNHRAPLTFCSGIK